MNVHSRGNAAFTALILPRHLPALTLTPAMTQTQPDPPVATLPAADQRISGILEAARLAFIEKGFDGASMQDLARAAGMSVGNFYRYFPSKAAMVEALVLRDMREMEADFATIINSADPMRVLRQTLQDRVAGDQCANDGQLWAEITAASLRKPEIGAVTARMEAAIIDYLTSVFARFTGLAPDAARNRFGAHAALIVMMVKASGMRSRDGTQTQADLTNLILRTIERTLDEITSDAPKG